MPNDFAKEMQIRRHVESIFNKTRADFEELRQWGDYEEEKEDIIYNLGQGIDVDAMQRKIAAYQKANADDILRNQALKAEKSRVQNRVPVQEQKKEEQGAELKPPGMQNSDAGHAYQPADITAHLQNGPLQILQQKPESDSPTKERPKLSMEEIGLISGWTPQLQSDRAREEAFACLFSF